MTTLRSTLTEAAVARSRWHRERIPGIELQAYVTTPAWLAERERVWEGMESITIATEQRKLIAWEEWPATSGEMAREYLRLTWATASTEVGASPRSPGFAWQAPIMARPVKGGLAYVDIASAYWQILGVYRPDDLPMGERFEPGILSWPQEQEMAGDRRLRHAVVGNLFSNKVSWLNRGNRIEVYSVKRWSQPFLKARCMSTLHAIACDIDANFRLHAWLTDAAIVDLADATDTVEYLAERWTIEARVAAAGDGAVWSVTSHQVGEKQTLDLVNGSTTPMELERRGTEATSTLRMEVPVPWLRTERKRRVRAHR